MYSLRDFINIAEHSISCAMTARQDADSDRLRGERQLLVATYLNNFWLGQRDTVTRDLKTRLVTLLQDLRYYPPVMGGGDVMFDLWPVTLALHSDGFVDRLCVPDVIAAAATSENVFLFYNLNGEFQLKYCESKEK